MKLATYKDGSRDGQLVVVSPDLSLAHYAVGVAGRLQQVLDDWNFLAPQLNDHYEMLNGGKARHAFPFDPQRCLAPLPRAFQCVLGTGGPEAPGFERLCGDPLAAAHEDAVLVDALDTNPADDGAGLRARPALAAFTADIPAGVEPAQALEGIRLLALAQTWECDADAGPTPPAGAEAPESGAATRVQLRPAFGPVVLTPDELTTHWRAGGLHAVLVHPGSRRQPRREDEAVATGFGAWIAALARHQPVRAGSIVLARFGVPAGAAEPAPLRAGDAARLSLRLAELGEPFGRMDQTVTAPRYA